MPERIWGFSKIVSFKTNNVNAQILGFLLNAPSSNAKIRVPDRLLVLIQYSFVLVYQNQGYHSLIKKLRRKKTQGD